MGVWRSSRAARIATSTAPGQTTSGGEFGPWHGLGGPWAGDPTLVAAAGRLELFIIGDDGALYRAAQDAAGGEFGGWQRLDGDWDARFAPVGGVNADGRLEVFTADLAGMIWHRWQMHPGGDFGPAQRLAS